jgi:excisionase family DNA binding protein
MQERKAFATIYHSLCQKLKKKKLKRKQERRCEIMNPGENVKIVYDSMDELLSVPDVAKNMGTTSGFIRKLIKYGYLPTIHFGKYPRIRKFTLNKFLAKIEGKDIFLMVNMREEKEKENGQRVCNDTGTAVPEEADRSDAQTIRNINA